MAGNNIHFNDYFPRFTSPYNVSEIKLKGEIICVTQPKVVDPCGENGRKFLSFLPRILIRLFAANKVFSQIWIEVYVGLKSFPNIVVKRRILRLLGLLSGHRNHRQWLYVLSVQFTFYNIPFSWAAGNSIHLGNEW